MTKTNLRATWWLAIILYIAFIYATLGVMPNIWDALNDMLAGKTIAILYIIYSLIATAILIHILFVKKEKSFRKYILFFLFMGIIFAMVKLVKFPAEKTHIAEYGLLGILVYNALKVDFDRFDKRLYLSGIVICLVVGALDEIIQGILPNRYFNWSDVLLNGVSGITTLLLIRFNILKN